MTTIFDNHIAVTAGTAMREICKPLEEYFNITDFAFEKIYKNNTKIKLTNRTDWLKEYYQRGFHLKGEFEQSIDGIQSGYRLASTFVDSQEIFKHCRDYFDIDHGIVLVDKYDDYCEFFWFGSTKDNSAIVQFYLNNMDLLRRFILYFKDKASSLIEQAEQQKIVLPNRALISDREMLIRKKTRQNFIDSIQVKKYRLSGKYSDVVLTEKEFECAVGLIEGKTANDIANERSRSRRTIETHIMALKSKLNCTSRTALVKILLDNGFGVYANAEILFV